MSNTLQPKTETRRLWLIAAGLFLASFLVRLTLAWHDKTIVVYYDETRYFEIARSLWQQGEVLILGTPSNFQKLLYPLVLSPAFALGSTTAAIRAIAVINSLLASSVVFPVLVMARRVLHTVWGTVLAMVLVLLLPDLAYSMTFMSETLTLPLTLWVILPLWQVWQTPDMKRKLLYAAVGGAASYVLYLGKEMGLAVALSFLLHTAVKSVLEKPARKSLLLAGAAYIAAFGLCFLFAKLVFFAGMGDSYTQTSFDIFDSVYRVFYMAYAMLVNSTMALVAFFYFPVAILFFRFSHLSRAQRDLFLFSLLCLFVSLAVISFSISVREDYGMAMPRQHLRYITPYFVPVLVLCIRQFEKKPGEGFRFKNPAFASGGVLVCGALFCGLVLYSAKPMAAAIVDNTMLKYYANLFSGALFPVLWAGEGQVLLYTGVFIVKAGLIAAVAVGSVALLRAKKRTFGAVLCAGIVAVCLVNNILSVKQFREGYAIPTETAAAADSMDAGLAGLDGTLLVITRAPLDSPQNRLADTYITANRYTVTEETLQSLQGENGEIDLAETALNEHLVYVWHHKTVPAFDTVEYLLVEAGGAVPATGTAELAATYVDGQYHLYRTIGGGRLAFSFPADENDA